MVYALVVYVVLVALETVEIALVIGSIYIDGLEDCTARKARVAAWEKRQLAMTGRWCLTWVAYLSVASFLLGTSTIVLSGVCGLSVSLAMRLVVKLGLLGFTDRRCNEVDS